MNTKQIGTITEYTCATYLLKLGCIISFPLGDYSSYDMIADYYGNLLRLQVKTSKDLGNGSFQFECTTSQFRGDGIHTRTYSDSEVDYFCTMFDGRCYLVRCSECNLSKILRHDLPKNLQGNNVSWAVNYEAEFVLNRLVDSSYPVRVDMDAMLDSIKENIRTTKLDKLSKKNSQYGSIWITDGNLNKKIKRSDDIPDGFKRGRVIKS